ncbi:hypothetical protein ACQ4PT_056343 [Festuca glaucescens]
MFEPSKLLADVENQIRKAKEETLSRKDVLEKVDGWMIACEEESWLEEYSRDDNIYSATRVKLVIWLIKFQLCSQNCFSIACSNSYKHNQDLLSSDEDPLLQHLEPTTSSFFKGG